MDIFSLLFFFFTTVLVFKFFVYTTVLNLIMPFFSGLIIGIHVAFRDIEEQRRMFEFIKHLKYLVNRNNSKLKRTLSIFTCLLPFHDVMTNYFMISKTIKYGGMNGIIIGTLKYYQMHIIKFNIPLKIVELPK